MDSNEPQVQLIAYTPEPERVIASAAKLCYTRSEPMHIYESLEDYEDVKDFLGRLSNYGHMSPMEHACFTFMISNVSRSLLAQITRHRIASFSVQSQRYNSMNNFNYVLPDTIEDQEDLKTEIEDVMDEISEGYDSLRNGILDHLMFEYVHEHIDELWDGMLAAWGIYLDDMSACVNPFIHPLEGLEVTDIDEKFVYVKVTKLDPSYSSMPQNFRIAKKAVAESFRPTVLGYRHFHDQRIILCQYTHGEDPDKNMLYARHMHYVYSMLFGFLDNYVIALGKASKRANEDARCILPNACTTNMVVTMNARELMHFFELRCCNRAQKEIRTLAWKMLQLVQEKAPTIFYDAGPACLRGPCPEGGMTCGNPYHLPKNAKASTDIKED